MDNKTKHLRKISLSPELEVKVKFEEVITIDPVNEADESVIITNEYQVKSKQRPHKDLVNTMKKLRKYALDICEIEVDSTGIAEWTVCEVKISGDIVLEQSRVVMTLAKEVKRTGKVITFATPQVTMYGESEYESVDKMTPIIEDLIEEVWSYLNGTKVDSSVQLALFGDMPSMKVA